MNEHSPPASRPLRPIQVPGGRNGTPRSLARGFSRRGFSPASATSDGSPMRQRFLQLLLAELLAFGSFVFGGLGVLGALVTWSGDSQHPPLLSWSLVAAFTLLAAALGAVAATRLRLVLWPRSAPPSAWSAHVSGTTVNLSEGHRSQA